MELELWYNGSLELQNVTIDGATTFAKTSDNAGTITSSNLTINSSAFTITQSGETSPLVRNALTDEMHLIVAGLADTIIVDLNNTGTLTLDLGDLDGLLPEFNAYYDSGATILVELDGIADLDQILGEDMDYSNLIVLIDGYYTPFIVDGISSSAGGNVMLTLIPEPSSSSLSLLAFAGLLARRRRKA